MNPPVVLRMSWPKAFSSTDHSETEPLPCFKIKMKRQNCPKLKILSLSPHPYAGGKSGEVSWSGAPQRKRRCGTFLNNWSRWGLVLKNVKGGYNNTGGNKKQFLSWLVEWQMCPQHACSVWSTIRNSKVFYVVWCCGAGTWWCLALVRD